jgi:pimeloyl-ACP methyl ester carboxylesterase
LDLKKYPGNKMEEKIVPVGKLKINYKIAGSGPAILVLHGWGSSSDSWVEMQKLLAEKGYLVVCPDLPGFGKSSLPESPYSVSDYEKIVVDFVKKIFPESSKELILLGHSFGGRISIKIIFKKSLKIKKLILCDPAGIKVTPSFKTKIILLISSAGDLIFSLKPLKKIKYFARNFFYFFINKRDYVKARGVMKETIKKVLKEDLRSELSSVKVKTLLLWGEKDKIVPLKYSQIFKERIENSRLEVFPKTGHSPHLECSSLLLEKIIVFLSENDD